jgi:hypothetical protein
MSNYSIFCSDVECYNYILKEHFDISLNLSVLSNKYFLCAIQKEKQYKIAAVIGLKNPLPQHLKTEFILK